MGNVGKLRPKGGRKILTHGVQRFQVSYFRCIFLLSYLLFFLIVLGPKIKSNHYKRWGECWLPRWAWRDSECKSHMAVKAFPLSSDWTGRFLFPTLSRKNHQLWLRHPQERAELWACSPEEKEEGFSSPVQFSCQQKDNLRLQLVQYKQWRPACKKIVTKPVTVLHSIALGGKKVVILFCFFCFI